MENKRKQCQCCTEKCPQEEMASEIAKGRMYATEKLVKAIALIEEMAEELENCYGRETELTQKARDFLNND